MRGGGHFRNFTHGIQTKWNRVGGETGGEEGAGAATARWGKGSVEMGRGGCRGRERGAGGRIYTQSSDLRPLDFL